MPDSWKKTKVYAKFSFICLVMLAVLVFILSNRQQVAIKFLVWTLVETWAWLLIVLAGLLGVVVFLVAGRIRSVVQQLKQVRSRNNVRDSNSRAADNSS